MLRRTGSVGLSLGVVLTLVALSAASASTHPVQILVPDTGWAVLGDGQSTTVTVAGPSSAYRTAALGQNNVADVVADDEEYPGYGRMSLRIDDLPPANRRLFLNITSPTPITYTCVKGPEDPNQASNRNNPRLGARIGISGGKAQLLCFDQTGTKGYMVYTPTSCVTISALPPTDPAFASHYVIDGRLCQANVYYLQKNQLTVITVDGNRRSPAKVFDFPIYFEADA